LTPSVSKSLKSELELYNALGKSGFICRHPFPGKENCRKSGSPVVDRDIHNNYGKSYLSKSKEKLKDKVSLYEKKSSQPYRKHNRPYGRKIKSIHMLRFLAVLESNFLVLYNL
jgi:hypothetical protein